MSVCYFQVVPDNDDVSRLKFEITSDDGFYVLADSLDKAWKAVTDAVQDARANARMKQLSYASTFSQYCICKLMLWYLPKFIPEKKSGDLHE